MTFRKFYGLLFVSKLNTWDKCYVGCNSTGSEMDMQIFLGSGIPRPWQLFGGKNKNDKNLKRKNKMLEPKQISWKSFAYYKELQTPFFLENKSVWDLYYQNIIEEPNGSSSGKSKIDFEVSNGVIGYLCIKLLKRNRLSWKKWFDITYYYRDVIQKSWSRFNSWKDLITVQAQKCLFW